jgi:hypothetical protein
MGVCDASNPRPPTADASKQANMDVTGTRRAYRFFAPDELEWLMKVSPVTVTSYDRKGWGRRLREQALWV